VEAVLVPGVVLDARQRTVGALVEIDAIPNAGAADGIAGALLRVAAQCLRRDPLAPRQLLHRHLAAQKALAELRVTAAHGRQVARDQRVNGARDEVAPEPLVSARAEGTAAEDLPAGSIHQDVV